jgi:hypothetical protein
MNISSWLGAAAVAAAITTFLLVACEEPLESVARADESADAAVPSPLPVPAADGSGPPYYGTDFNR